MPRGQMFRGGYFLRTACHSSQAAFVTSNRRRRRFSAGGLSRAAVNCLYAFSSSRKHLWSRSTAVASRQAASSMNSDRFFPSFSAARSIRARLSLSARRLIVTPRPARSAVSVFGIAFLLYIQSLYRVVCTMSTHYSVHRKHVPRSRGTDVRPNIGCRTLHGFCEGCGFFSHAQLSVCEKRTDRHHNGTAPEVQNRSEARTRLFGFSKPQKGRATITGCQPSGAVRC